MNRLHVSALALALTAGLASGSTIVRGFDNSPDGSGPLAAFPHSDAARSLFLGLLSGPTQTQNFESTPTGSVPTSWSFSGGMSATFADAATVSSSINEGPSSVATYPADGKRYLYSETRPGASFFKLSFETNVNAIGFYFSDASDWFGVSDIPGAVYIELLNADDGVVNKYDLTQIPISSIKNGGMGYFGVKNDLAFRSIRISQPLRASGGNADSDAIGFDQFTIAVPAPGAVGVLAIAGLASSRRRRMN